MKPALNIVLSVTALALCVALREYIKAKDEEEKIMNSVRQSLKQQEILTKCYRHGI
jgi:hypothetical protein